MNRLSKKNKKQENNTLKTFSSSLKRCRYSEAMPNPNLWGNFTPSWFSLNKSETVKATTLAFCSIT